MIKMTRKLFYGIGLGFVILLLIGLLWAWSVVSSLPDVSSLRNYKPQPVSEVYDRNGRAILQIPQNPSHLWVPLSEISESLQMAVITMEDDTFFQHKGINYKETWNAFKEDLKKGKYKRGGSTITQQLAKNLFLSKEKTLTRKLKEYFLARRIEEILPKERILELYLNEAEWGDKIYGAEPAARFYFDKHASELNLPESALLAAMLSNPHYYNPFKNLERIQNRQKRLFSLLRTDHMINDEEYQEALQAPLVLQNPEVAPQPKAAMSSSKDSPPPACHLRLLQDYLIKTYGQTRLTGGELRLRTTLDLPLQRMLEAAAREADVPMNPASPSLFLAVKEGDVTRGLICVETGEIGIKVINHLEQLSPSTKSDIFSFENLESFRWEPLFPIQAPAVSAP
jgi:penicillin-binding protein 1A